MLPFAELPAPDSGPGIGWLLMGIGAIFLILNQGADFINRFRAKEPAPPDPPLHKEYVSRAEFETLCESIINRFQSVDDRWKALNDDRRDNAQRLHNRVDDCERTQREGDESLRREVKGDIEGIYRAINSVSKEVSTMSGALALIAKNSNHPFSQK